MKKNSKKKTIVRFFAAIVIIVLVGAASYYGSKALFLHKFTSDKEKEQKKQEEEVKSSIKDNYISVIRVGKLTTLRIFNTKTSKLSFIVMRPDSDLFTYNEDGSGQKITKVVNNIQNAYGITVDSYEDYDQEGFSNLINNTDSYECNFPYAVAFKDTNKMTVHLKDGEHILNGNQTWGVISGEAQYNSQKEYMANTKAILEGYLTTCFKDADSDRLKEYADVIFANCTSNVKEKDIQNYLAYYAKVKTDDILVTEFEGKESSSKFEVDINKAKSLISQLTSSDASKTTEKKTEKVTTEKATKATTEEVTTTEEKKEAISSEGKNIYIRNAAYVNGLATKWTRQLRNDGFTIGSVNNYSKTYQTTIIKVKEKGMGEDLKEKYFKDAKIEVGGVESGSDICIYLGKDANTL